LLPDTLILGFDTSAAHCAAALLQGDRLLVARLEPMDKGQAERLMPLLAEVLAEAGKTWADLTALAVGVGPGNFTGIRIAVAAARGLALGLGIPAHGVTRFDALALDLPRPLAVVEDARRGEVYVQAFDGSDFPPRLAALADLPGLIGALPVVGSAAEAGTALTGGACLAPRYPMAEAIARAALHRAPGPRPAPFYLRAADAAPPSDPPPVILP